MAARTDAMKKACTLDWSLSASGDMGATAHATKAKTFACLGDIGGFSTGDWAARPRGAPVTAWIAANGPPGVTNSCERERVQKDNPGLANAWQIAIWPGFVPLMTALTNLAQTDAGIEQLFAFASCVASNVATFGAPGRAESGLPTALPVPGSATTFEPCWQLKTAVEFACSHFKYQHAKVLRSKTDAARERWAAESKVEEGRAKGDMERATAGIGKGGQQATSVEHPPTGAQIAEDEAARALGAAAQARQREQAKRKSEVVCREELEALHVAPLLERPGVAPFRWMLQFSAFARVAGEAALAALRGDPAAAAFRPAALRFKAHALGADAGAKDHVAADPLTWKKPVQSEGHAPVWDRVTRKSADQLVAEVASSFRGTPAQWEERLTAIARLPADVDKEFVRYGPFVNADERQRGVRVELIAALPASIRADYQARFKAGAFAAHPLDASGRDPSEVYDQLTPHFSVTGEPAKRLKGHGPAPTKAHVRAGGLAHQLAACAAGDPDGGEFLLEILAACESGGELKGHVLTMEDALLKPTGNYSN